MIHIMVVSNSVSLKYPVISDPAFSGEETVQRETSQMPLGTYIACDPKKETIDRCFICYETPSESEKSWVAHRHIHHNTLSHHVHANCVSRTVEARVDDLRQEGIIDPWFSESQCFLCRQKLEYNDSTEGVLTSSKNFGYFFLQNLVHHGTLPALTLISRKLNDLPDRYLTSSQAQTIRPFLSVSLFIASLYLNDKIIEIFDEKLPLEGRKFHPDLVYAKATSSKRQMNQIWERELRFWSVFSFTTGLLITHQFLPKRYDPTPENLIGARDILYRNILLREIRLFCSVGKEFDRAVEEGNFLSNSDNMEKFKTAIHIPKYKSIYAHNIIEDPQNFRAHPILIARENFIIEAICRNGNSYRILPLIIRVRISKDNWFETDEAVTDKRLFYSLIRKEASAAFEQELRAELTSLNIQMDLPDQWKERIEECDQILDSLFQMIERDGVRNNPVFSDLLAKLITTYPVSALGLENARKALAEDPNSIEEVLEQVCNLRLKYFFCFFSEDRAFKDNVDIESELKKVVKSLLLLTTL